MTSCPVPGCAGTQKTGKLMCLRHWRFVSDGTQKEVYRSWRAFNRAAMSDRSGKLAAYRVARDKAIAEATREQQLHDGTDPLDRMVKAAEGLMP
ncbi:hypothetical protein [Azospirillum picis]|uniref:Uncharacterized protein n=1 Tax=Azospirillum picis TaxID=488438 RepID=A0ABU0MNS2_9PROT|nr:hypothetical protein [Azospirillum picis]MBP2301284.1 hypothetical protein [Azospirillum picis]MDQ0535115.1 hypothetical protein [Azospirillum picis]